MKIQLLTRLPGGVWQPLDPDNDIYDLETAQRVARRAYAFGGTGVYPLGIKARQLNALVVWAIGTEPTYTIERRNWLGEWNASNHQLTLDYVVQDGEWEGTRDRRVVPDTYPVENPILDRTHA